MVVALLAGCEDGASAPPATQRVVSVTQDRAQAPDLASFCDVHADGEEGRRLTFPPLDQTLPAQGSRWRWVNVWATWCRPCIEEMPMLLEWQSRLNEGGATLDLVFLSVDEEAETVTQFRRAHPRLPESVRLTDQGALQDWIAGLGLDAGATLPLHIFADPNGNIRCARSGAVAAPSYETVRLLVTSR
jgi:thiol-disulfide isomerase/thioredoxin